MSEKIIEISPAGNSLKQSIRELRQSPGVLRALTWRDIQVRYAQTLLGIAWAVIQPLLGLAAIFVLFFKLAGISSGETPYLVFALSGLIIWNYFSFVVTQSAAGLVHMQAMIRKIYFPRLSIPFSKAAVGLVDLGIGVLLLLGVMLFYGSHFAGLWVFPIILLATMTCALGVGLVISAISLRYRDLQQALPFLMQILFFLTPVAYPSSLLNQVIPEAWQWLAYLNPMMGILELWRGVLFGSSISVYASLSMLVAASLFILGIILFSRAERKMADLL